MSLLPTAAQADRERVRRAVEDALARPEFEYDDGDGLFERLAELRDQFLDWLGDLFGGFAGSAAGEVFGWLVLIALVVTTLAVVILTLLRLQGTGRSSKRGARPVAADEATTESLLPDRDLARARELAAAGRFEEAMHALYRGVLLWLDRGGHARFEEDKTGGEVARELQGDKRSGFRVLLSVFYPVAFGGRAPSDRSWARMRTAASELGVPE